MKACLSPLLPPPRIALTIRTLILSNKRLAAAITETFIESNGGELLMNDDEVVTLFLDIAAGIVTRDDSEGLLRRNIRKRNS